jgi:hypothetical protein
MNDAAHIDAPPSRKPLLAAAVLFAAWFGFLAYEVATSANPVILSRPQILASDVVVEGRLLRSPSRVAVEKVWWGDESLRGKELNVSGLAFAESPSTVIVALQQAGKDRYRIQPIPADAGADRDVEAPGFYPAEPEVLKELSKLLDFRRSETPSRGSDA